MSLLLLALVAAAPVSASTFVAMSRGELLAQSDAIVEGMVLKTESRWTVSGRLIVTEALVQVTDVVAGEAPGVVTVRTYGGEIGGYTVEAHGFPKFAQGERVFLFLQNQPDGAVEVTGYRLGQYRVVRDKAGVEMAIPTLEPGVSLLTPSGAAAPRPAAMKLETLKNLIRVEAERVARPAK
jgi:hypothetical protein